MISILLGVLKWSCIFCGSFIIIVTIVSLTSGILYGIAKCFKRWGK